MSLPAQATVPETAADPTALIGRVLDGRYEVTGLLGVGGIGRVYRAKHRKLKRDVAIKVLLEHYACVPDLQRRFEREAMALAALSHPNIVTITDFVATKDVTFLVMELVEGEDLDSMIERGPLPPEQAFQILEQVLSSLAYAHERDVIHRDLKPQNVLVRSLPGGRVHAEILDFGLAKFMDGSGPSAGLTKTGLIVGTPAYMAPEQASGAHADQRADVYAAGIMLFELLTGSHPFNDAEGADMLRQHLLAPPPTLADRCPGAHIAPELEEILRRSLAKDGADRYADGAAMLEAVLALPRDPFRPVDAPESRKRIEVMPTAMATRPGVLPNPSGATKRKKPRSRAGLFTGLLVLLAAAAAAAWVIPRLLEPAPAEGATGQDATTAPVPPASPAAHSPAAQPATGSHPAVAPEASEEDELGSDEEEAEGEGDAPLVEDEEEQQEVAPPTVRPPPRNPWAGRLPEPLSRIHRRLARNQSVSQRSLLDLARYRRSHPSDNARATLLLGSAYAARGWLTNALTQYQRAYRRDPSVRGDPRMMRDLLRMAGSETLHEQATAAILEIYGAEAQQAVERTIGRERDVATRGRLQDTLRRLR